MPTQGILGRNFKWWDGQKWRPDPATPTGAVIAAGSAATTTTITSIPTSVNGTAGFTISGTVSPNPGGGTVQLYRNGAAYGSAVAVSGGNWSASAAESSTSTWYAVFSGFSVYTASTSASKSVTCKVLTTYTKSYACTGTGSYRGSGTKRTDTSHAYQGYFDGTNGLQRSILLFPYSTIASDLAGATVTKSELYLNCLHWGPDSGGTAVIDDHNYSSLPASDPTISTTYASTTAWTTKTGAKWCVINNGSVNRIVAGTAKGIALYTTSTATEYYGYFAGNGETGEPVLRVTYQKWV